MTDVGNRALEDPIELFLVDGQTMFRDGLRLLAEQQPDLVVVGVAADATSAPACDGVPDVVVADLALSDAHDVGAVDRLRKTFPGSALLVLTLADHPKYVERVLNARCRRVRAEDGRRE
jgi:DNA-binding NarL/FixJ family response regulator